ncbi:MAG: non-canonical purine NTP diphosphatase [Allomuricauda sp.]|nr:MAG: non-canonical purine NTP diphosphatase [Allomuricauda sp.]
MQLVFATHNQHKFQEVKAMVPTNIQLLSLKDLGLLDDIPETGKTLAENAQIKADFITQKFNIDCFADDTGLVIEVLDGEPGVYSARYAGTEKDDDANMQKVLAKLKDHLNRGAHFKTVFALNLGKKKYLFEGIVHGEIITEKRGNEGFGYDPIFKPSGYEKTFAELTLETKNKISHRAKAMQQLIDFLSNMGSQR